MRNDPSSTTFRSVFRHSNAWLCFEVTSPFQNGVGDKIALTLMSHGDSLGSKSTRDHPEKENLHISHPSAEWM